MAAATLALLPCALLWEAVLGRAVLYERDIHSYWVPAIEAFVRAVAEGAWPLWDPLTNFGRPMLADPSMQVGYAPTWLNLVLSPGAYYTAFVVAHCAWAGLGAHRLARAWGLGPAAAWWSGALWLLCGPFLSMASLYHHFASASWMAWVLLALEGVIVGPGARSAGLLGLAAAGMALAGSADVCVMTAVAAVARAAFAARPWADEGMGARALGAMAAAAGVAALLSAVQWWPTLAHVAVGSRGATGAAASMYWSAHPASLLDVFLPGLVSGLPLGPVWRAALFESRGPLLRSLYLGIPALALAACALVCGRWRFRWLAAGLAAGFALAALGRFTPFFPALVGLPVVRLLRFPVKYAVPAALFASLLSGAGIDALLGERDPRARRRMTGLAAVLGVAVLVAAALAFRADRIVAAAAPFLASPEGVAGPLRMALLRAAVLALLSAGAMVAARGDRPRRAPLAAALAAAVADLFLAARGAVPLGPPELLRHRPPILDAFAPRPADHRLYPFQYGIEFLNAQFTRRPARWDPEWAWALGHAERLAPPIPTRWGIAGSFDGDFTGLSPVALSRLTAYVHAHRGDPEGLRMMRMASVTDVVSLEEAFDGRPPRAERLSVYTAPVRVFTVTDPLPRAYLVTGVRAEEPPGAASVVTAPGFDARREVSLDPASGRAPSPPGGDAGTAAIDARRADRLRVSVSARAPAVLVVTEAWDPGWRAWVDGSPAPVWRANAVFRGVPVPEGDHVVEMRYRPPSVAWGAAATVLGAALAGALIGRRRP